MEPKTFYLVDIDGTVADLAHRLHFIEHKPADWDSFFSACDGDAPIYTVIKTVQMLKNAGADIIMISGRSDATRQKTLTWLDKYDVPCDELYMRKDGDHRSDDVVKSELLDAFLSNYHMDVDGVMGAFEDRDQVVKMYRERGIRVFQVAYGNF